MKRSIKDYLLLLWDVYSPDWILPLMLACGLLATAALFWAGISALDRAPMGDPVTVHGTVDRFSVNLGGKFYREGLAQVTIEGRTHYFPLSVAADCRRGDRIEVSKRSRPLKSPVFFPASGQPCRRP